MTRRLVELIIFALATRCLRCAEYTEFPEGFKFGFGSASYQIEGAWNISGKGENIWDRMVHEKPHSIAKNHNGDEACDSYHRYEEDVAILKHLGADYYRFSISWSRIMPTGYNDKINPDGIRYYNDLINELLANNIEPMITMFHWDLPQPLQDLGGWQNEVLVDYFTDYARVLYENFGDRVKMWLTFNEPWVFCEYGYGGKFLAPVTNSPGVGVYMCGQTVLKAHAKAYRMYATDFRSEQKGRVSIAFHYFGWVPKTNRPEDIAIAEKARQFKVGWFAHPIFSKNGDYPQIMKDSIAEKSKRQGYSRSRLPKLSEYWVDLIKGTGDFMALNMYTSYVVEAAEDMIGPSWQSDIGMKLSNLPEWPLSACKWMKEVPEEFGNMFRWIRREYGDREIIVTENGWADDGSDLDDPDRIRYVHRHLSEMLIAIHRDAINITRYTHWSFMDNLEWVDGYTKHFGLYRVDFESPEKIRTPKSSVEYFRKLISRRRLPEEVNENLFASNSSFFPKKTAGYHTEDGMFEK